MSLNSGDRDVADNVTVLAPATVAMRQFTEGERKLHLSAVQLNRNDMKVEVWTLGEVKAENMSADSGFLVVRISEFDLKEVEKKSSTKAKIPL